MRIIYTQHVKLRMVERNISNYSIEQAIKYPDQVLLQENGRLRIHKHDLRGRLVVICKKSHTVCVIITIF